MSTKYKPPGSKTGSKSNSPRRKSRFISTEPVKEKPPDTSSSDLFPTLGGENNAAPTTATATKWGGGVIIHSEPPRTQHIKSETVVKLDICNKRKPRVIDVDPSFAIATMNRQNREAAELNSLNGYRDDYVYLHELDELERDRDMASDDDNDDSD